MTSRCRTVWHFPMQPTVPERDGGFFVAVVVVCLFFCDAHTCKHSPINLMSSLSIVDFLKYFGNCIRSKQVIRCDFVLGLLTASVAELGLWQLSVTIAVYGAESSDRSLGVIVTPSISKNRLGGRAFSYWAPLLWNQLSPWVREADTLTKQIGGSSDFEVCRVVLVRFIS